MQRWTSILIVVALLSTLPGVVTAVEECVTPVICPSDISGNLTSTDICIYYFYGQGCPHCANIRPFIDAMVGKYSRVQLYEYEIYFNSTNQALFQNFVSRYEITQAGVPALFVGDQALVGEKVIRDNLENSIQYFYNHEPICPSTYRKSEGGPHDISPGENIDLTVPSVIVSAIIDSINPCAFAVLIFLLVYLTSMQLRKRMLPVGMAYIVTVFVVYFLSGLGFFALIQSTNLTGFVFTGAALIAIIAGAINLKDFFWYGKGISLSIPESKKETIKNVVTKASVPSAIVLGGLVSMFELPCTGGIYLAILSLLSSRMTLVQGIPYLLIYNVIFILPLIVILFIVYFGISAERVEAWRGEEKRWMRLGMGLVMVSLGMLMLMGVL